jgi:ferredoxin-nitrite reductase
MLIRGWKNRLTNAPPTPADNSRWRYYGLFYVAPNQTSYMCRLRIPNGILKHWQFVVSLIWPNASAAAIRTYHPRQYPDQEIPPKHTVALLEGIQDIGLCSRGSGADNIRNVTGTPTAGSTAGIDRHPRIRPRMALPHSQRPLADGIAAQVQCRVDGAGKIAVLEDTNDIAFAAVEVKDGFGVDAGVWLAGHRRHHRSQGFRQDTGIIVKPEDATKWSTRSCACSSTGDRTNR